MPIFLTNDIESPEVYESFRGADIGVSINWISIIPQPVLDLFSCGILNTHSGDLPAYRGNACPNWAIINGEERITLSCHLMEGGRLDCGRIIQQAHLPLTDRTCYADVLAWSRATIPGLVCASVDALANDPGHTQKYADVDGEQSFRCFPRRPEDSFLDWNDGVETVDRLVRASSEPLQGAYTFIVDDGTLKRLHILKGSIHAESTRDCAVPGQIMSIDRTTGCILVKCGDGVLNVESCRIDDGEVFSPATRFTSVRTRLGVRPEDYLWALNRNSS